MDSGSKRPLLLHKDEGVRRESKSGGLGGSLESSCILVPRVLAWIGWIGYCEGMGKNYVGGG